MSHFTRFFTQLFTQPLDGLLGRGEHAITVPAMDGALRPNTLLDQAAEVEQAASCDNLTLLGEQIAYTVGTSIRAVGWNGIAQLACEISCLTALPSGGAVAGCTDGSLHKLNPDGSWQKITVAIPCPTAALALDDKTVLITSGAENIHPKDWSHDLLTKGRSGSVHRVDLEHGEALCLARNLAWPSGLAAGPDGTVFVSEAWSARILRIGMDGARPVEMLGNLPGYPGRLSRGTRGYWLTIFAPRSQLLEFVLREPKFRRKMMAEIDPSLWIAPSLRAGSQVLEPLQAGGVRQLGQLKPWAPMRSFGLIVELSPDLSPLRSFHSRADGNRHGVTSTLEADGQLIFTAKGDGVIGKFDLEARP